MASCTASWSLQISHSFFRRLMVQPIRLFSVITAFLLLCLAPSYVIQHIIVIPSLKSLSQMSFGVPFRCKTNDNNSFDNLCFYGGKCAQIENSSFLFCDECDPGWEHSTIFGHYKNCCQPVLFLPIFFAIHLVISVIALLSLYFALRTTRDPALRKLGITCVIQVCVEAIRTFCFFIENGTFIAGNLALTVQFILAMDLFVQLNLIFLTATLPLLRSAEKIRIQTFWRYLQFFLAISLVCCGITAAIYSQGNDQEYNLVFIVFMDQFPIHSLCLFLATKICCFHLCQN